MRRVSTVASVVLLFSLFQGVAHGAGEQIEFGRFGKVALYRTTPHPGSVVLFVSGDGGWNKGAADMARALSSLDALVAGIDITRYLRNLDASREQCLYPAADFEALSKFIQKKLAFPRYRQPVLVGYSSGATLVYAVIFQAPPNTFRGGISLGFCPDFGLRKPLCRGYGLIEKPGPHGRGHRFLPAKQGETPWIALQGTIDQVCNAEKTEAFVKQIPHAEVVLLPKVGHGFSVQKNWMPHFKKAFLRLLEKPDGTPRSENVLLQDLPLVEITAREPASDTLAVIISGDGGWAGIDRDIGNTLAQKGIAVVGLNSLQYFWTARTPDGAAADLDRILRHYLSAWNKRHAILVGYSLGADVLPFMASRLPDDLRDRVRLIALVGPGQKAAFEFHLADWLGLPPAGKRRPILPELEKLRGKKVLCFYGEEEAESLCRGLDRSLAEAVPMKGAHHFGGKYEKIAEIILQRAR